MDAHPTHADLCRFLDAYAPFVKSMGISCEELRPGYAIARWRQDPRWLRPGAYLFGGGLMTLADAALYMAILMADGGERLIAHATSSYALPEPEGPGTSPRSATAAE